MKFKKNIGRFDRLLRLGIAVILFVLADWKESWLLLVLALFTLYEACASWCVLYQILGKSSCPVKKKKNSSS